MTDEPSIAAALAKPLFLAVASVLAALSIKPAGLVLAFLCCVIGAMFAKPTSSRFRDATIFLSVVFVGAAGGAWVGQSLEGREILGLSLEKAEIPATAILSLFFHPLLHTAAKWLPARLMKDGEKA